MKIMEKIKNEVKFSNSLPFRSNAGYVKMMPLMPYMTNIMCIFGHKIINRKLMINSISIGTGYVEYIMA